MATTLFTPAECKALAIGKAGWFANEMWRKTGRKYEVRAHTMGRQHVVEVIDTERPRFEMGFEGSTWEQVFLSVRDAWNAYCAVRDCH